MTNTEAEKTLNQFVVIQTSIKDAEMAMYQSMKSILPAKKILKLHSVEQDFSRRILEEMKKRKEGFRERRGN